MTSCVKRKVDGQKLVLKQTQCENVRAGNDALREAKVLQVKASCLLTPCNTQVVRESRPQPSSHHHLLRGDEPC